MGALKWQDRLFGFPGADRGRDTGRVTNQQLADIAAGLRNFKPVRIRSLAGTATYDQEGINFDLNPRVAAGSQSMFDFFGNTSKQLAEFNEGDATAKTLALLRQRRAEAFDPALAGLESRLLQQGRLGLATGGRGANPEMTSFFGAEAMADLEAQLQSSEEARRQRDSLLQSAGGAYSLGMESAMPSQMLNGLFSAQELNQARDISAAEIASYGPRFEFAGTMSDIDRKYGRAKQERANAHEFGMSAWNAYTGGSFNKGTMGSAKKT